MKLPFEERIKRMVATLRSFRAGYALEKSQAATPEPAAAQWVDNGLNDKRAQAWLGAGCFNPVKARELGAVGITPAMTTAIFIERSQPYLGMKRIRPLGAAVADGTVDVQTAKSIVMDRGLLVSPQKASRILEEDAKELTAGWTRQQFYVASEQWAEIGFAPHEMRGYLAARCFTPEAALALREGGITPQQAARSQSVVQGEDGHLALDPRDTIGWRVADGKSSVPAATAAIERLESVERILGAESVTSKADRAPVEIAAVQWTARGFMPADVQKWTDARTFDPEAATALRSMGVTPDQAAVRTVEGKAVTGRNYTQSVGFKVSLGDLTPEQGKELIHGGPDVQGVVSKLKPTELFSPDGVARAASRWERMGFTLGSEINAWAKNACCFFPECAKSLKKMGVTPTEAAIINDDGGYKHTIGFKYARGDISKEQVMSAVERARALKASSGVDLKQPARVEQATPAVLLTELRLTVAEEFKDGKDMIVTNPRYAEIVAKNPDNFLLDPSYDGPGVRVIAVTDPILVPNHSPEQAAALIYNPHTTEETRKAALIAVLVEVPVVGNTQGAALPVVQQFETVRASVLQRLYEGKRDVIVTGEEAEIVANAEKDFRIDETYVGEGVRVAAAADPETGKIVYNQYGVFMQDVKTKALSTSDQQVVANESASIKDYYIPGEEPAHGQDNGLSL